MSQQQHQQQHRHQNHQPQQYKVVPPWATLNDSQLGLKNCNKSYNSQSKKDENYLVQPPWVKKGNNKIEETQLIRKGLEVRFQRRVENDRRDKAIRNLSKVNNDEARIRSLEYRKLVEEEKKNIELERKTKRQNETKSTKSSMMGLSAEKKTQALLERERAQKEAKESVERKRILLAKEKQSIVDEREKSIKVGQENGKRRSELQEKRREQAHKYKQSVTEENASKRTNRAELQRKERLYKKNECKLYSLAAKDRKNIRPVWMMEEKEEQSLHHKEINIAANKRKNDISDTKFLETSHLSAVEKIKQHQEEFYERNIAPLERKSTLLKQRNLERKQEKKTRQKQINKDMLEQRRRRNTINQQLKANGYKPLSLG